MWIATWNLNSIKARLERLLSWLDKRQPDVVCLQEIKCIDDNFPVEVIQQRGYHAYFYGQRTYNGVAILSKSPLEVVAKGFNDEDQQKAIDTQARWLHARTQDGLHIISAYIPNGSEVGSEKYTYKLQWLQRLSGYFEAKMARTERLVLCGDFNIALDDLDVAKPDEWRQSVLCHEDARQALRQVTRWGLIDAFRYRHPTAQLFSWWDYRQLAFPKNNGLRIDHIYVSENLKARVGDVQIDRDERKGKSPSDHVPVLLELKD